MKNKFLSLCLFLCCTTIFAQQKDNNLRPQPGPAPVINLADAKSFILENGLKVFVVENHKLPRVTYSIQLDIHPGTENEKSGARSLVGSLITAGTSTKTKEQFDNEIDMIGASIGASSSGMFGQSLTKHQDKLLELMSDALINAQFQESELAKLKKQMESGLSANRNDPDQMLQNVSAALNYGKNHPYGEITTEETVSNITLNDCIAYYKTYFRPNVAYMAVVGDITIDQAKELVTKYFSKWQKADVPNHPYPDVPTVNKTQVDFVSRDGAVQSVIGITYPIELPIGTPDVIKTRVLNEILGGSSQGRLFQNLREKHAWTYGSYSSIAPNDIVGSVTIYAKCRNEVTDSSITEMLKEVNRLKNESIDYSTLQGTINYISGKFAIGLENPQTIAQYAINVERYNMPKDYYKNYLKNLNQIGIEDVQEAAQKYLTLDKAHIVVVGNKSELEKLKKFSEDGVVNFYDHYANPIEPVVTQEVDGVTANDVLNNYVQAIGGKAVIEGLKDISIKGTGEQMGQQFNLNILIASPGKLKQTIISQGMEVMKQVLNGEKAYMQQMGGQKIDITGEDMEQMKPQADLQEILHPEKYGISYTLIGKEQQDGKEIYQLEKVSNNGKKRTIQYYAVQNGLLVKEISNMEVQGQQVIEIKSFSDYKEVKGGNGYKMAHKIETTGTISAKLSISSVKINSGIKDSEFQ